MASRTEGAFMISTKEYMELVMCKARLVFLEETFQRYVESGCEPFIETCRRTFKLMNDERGEKNDGTH